MPIAASENHSQPFGVLPIVSPGVGSDARRPLAGEAGDMDSEASQTDIPSARDRDRPWEDLELTDWEAVDQFNTAVRQATALITTDPSAEQRVRGSARCGAAAG